MPRITSGRGSRLAALLAAAVLGLALAAGASADTPPGRGPNGGPAPIPSPTPPAGDCAVLRVQLSGTQPATQTCLAAAAQPAQGTGGAADNVTGTSYCYQGDVELYEHTNYGGKRLCFGGWGSANLRDYILGYSWGGWVEVRWDDKVSSFRTRSHKVVFYEHANTSGEKLRYLEHQERFVMRDGWNDRVSSLCIPSNNLSWYPCP